MTFNHEESMLRALEAYDGYNHWCAYSRASANSAAA